MTGKVSRILWLIEAKSLPRSIAGFPPIRTDGRRFFNEEQPQNLPARQLAGRQGRHRLPVNLSLTDY